jgi:hypothetical protein
VHFSPAFFAASAIFLAIMAGILFVVRAATLTILAGQWQKGNFIPISLGLRGARVKAGEPLLASMPATLHPAAAGEKKKRGLLVLTPSRISFQSGDTSANLPLRAIRHLTVQRDGRLEIRTDGASLGGALDVPNPPAVAKMIQAAFSHPRG